MNPSRGPRVWKPSMPHMSGQNPNSGRTRVGQMDVKTPHPTSRYQTGFTPVPSSRFALSPSCHTFSPVLLRFSSFHPLFTLAPLTAPLCPPFFIIWDPWVSFHLISLPPLAPSLNISHDLGAFQVQTIPTSFHSRRTSEDHEHRPVGGYICKNEQIH